MTGISPQVFLIGHFEESTANPIINPQRQIEEYFEAAKFYGKLQPVLKKIR